MSTRPSFDTLRMSGQPLAEDDGSADEAGYDDAHRDRDLPQFAGHVAVVAADVARRGLRGHVAR
jgi:hypothetical protein